VRWQGQLGLCLVCITIIIIIIVISSIIIIIIVTTTTITCESWNVFLDTRPSFLPAFQLLNRLPAVACGYSWQFGAPSR
jgi:hypothetical protein